MGVLIEHLDYNLTENLLFGKVIYFPLHHNSEFSWEKDTVLDTYFKWPKDKFLKEFQVLANPEGLKDFREAKWKSIEELLEEA